MGGAQVSYLMLNKLERLINKNETRAPPEFSIFRLLIKATLWNFWFSKGHTSKLLWYLFKVEKCPFSQKSARVFERKKAFYGEENKLAFFSLKSALFKVEKCPFSQKSTLLFERKKGLLRGGKTFGLFCWKVPFLKLKSALFLRKAPFCLREKKPFTGR